VIKKLLGHEGCIRSASFSPDGKMIISGSEDYNLILWNVETGEMIG